MHWPCLSCGWVNTTRGLCENCKRPKGAPCENVAVVVEPAVGAGNRRGVTIHDCDLSDSYRARTGKHWVGASPVQLDAEGLPLG